MKCYRCQQDFDRAELRPPSLLLRILAAPYFLLVLKLLAFGGELTAVYCRPCRRRLNVCFLFIAFLVVVFVFMHFQRKFNPGVE